MLSMERDGSRWRRWELLGDRVGDRCPARLSCNCGCRAGSGKLGLNLANDGGA